MSPARVCRKFLLKKKRASYIFCLQCFKDSILYSNSGPSPMSIESLEERYQNLKQGMRIACEHLSRCALRASAIQNQMRRILSEVALDFCGPCEHKCCEGFPLEGWFSFEDYVLFRQKYDRPAIPHNRIRRDTACYFLTPEGCSLPADMRPFTCVKVNCQPLNDVLRQRGKEHNFNLLRKSLDAILFEVSQRINDNGSAQATVHHPQQDANDAPSINICGG